MADELTPEQQEAEEFEFRARAEEEARARAIAAQNSAVATNDANATQEPSMLGKIAGGAQVAGEMAAEHPIAASLLAGGAATALSKVPYVGPAMQSVAGAFVPQPIKTMANAIPSAMSNWASSVTSADAQTLQRLQSTALQYSKNNLPIPADVQRGIDQLSQKLYKPVVPTGPIATGPVAPTGAAVNAAEQGLSARVRDAAAQRIANLPAMGEMLGGAARMAGRVLGPASLALQTTDLGPQTPQLGRMRGMEINPLTGQRWTPEQIRQYESNPSMFDSQLAQPQFRR